MINLSKKRIVIYMYFTLVFSLIFGLSFTVQGEKISGAFVVEITNNLVEKISLLSLTLIIFAFLVALAFSLFVIRHVQESGHIHHTKIKKTISIVIAMNVIGLISLGVYFGSGEDKITGYVISNKELSTLLKQYTGRGAKATDYEDAKSKALKAEATNEQFDLYWSSINGKFPVVGPNRNFLDYLVPGRRNPEIPVTVNGVQYVVHTNKFGENSRLLVTDENGVVEDDSAKITAALDKSEVYFRTAEYTTGSEETLVKVDPRTRIIYEIKGDGTLKDITGDLSDKQQAEARVNAKVDFIFAGRTGKDFVFEQFYQYVENGRWVIKKYENGEPMGDPIKNKEFEELLAASKEFKFIHQTLKRDVASLLNDAILYVFEDFYNEQLDAICKAEHDSSEPFSSTPTSTTQPFVNNFLFPVTDTLCQNSLTIITAQATKLLAGPQIEYETSYTITACNITVQYNVLLESDLLERTNIASGITNFSNISSEVISLTHTIDFDNICVEVTDRSIGEDGKVCFEIIDLN